MLPNVSTGTPTWLVAPHKAAQARATIADVARVAGVNKGTASRALRGLAGVGESTRLRVIRAADELAYSASHLATTLATGQSGIVGIVLPSLRNWYFVEVSTGASEVLHAAGFRVELIHLNMDSDALPIDSATFSQLLADLGVGRGRDLLMYAGTTSQMGDLGPPGTVPAATREGSVTSVPGIRIDHQRGARLAGEHLISLGHERIATIEARVPDKIEKRLWDQRRAGLCEAFAAAGLALEKGDIWCPGGASPAHGKQAMTEILTSPRHHSAVFCQTDELAFGALAAVRQAGRRCPDDISVVGFDGHPMSPYWGLTTIDQHAHEQGVRAARALLGVVDGQHMDESREEGPLTEALVVRETSGPPGA
jgi:LacI family transcriptional regulator, repressor for deo operon, udp, cdd, tsx, nupC, and nupG